MIIMMAAAMTDGLTSLANLAADYGWGPNSLLWIFLITTIVATAMFLIVMASTRAKKKMTYAAKRRYHPETYWLIGVAGVLIWLWVISYPWMPPVAFSNLLGDGGGKAATPTAAAAITAGHTPRNVQVVDITAGQWFWIMNMDGNSSSNSTKPGNPSPHIVLQAGEPVKFVAHSVDVNHGFGVFKKSGDSEILLQMQVIPGLDNVFYYTFDQPGDYMVRCLEYCGYAHPYMTSMIHVVPGNQQLQVGGA